MHANYYSNCNTGHISTSNNDTTSSVEYEKIALIDVADARVLASGSSGAGGSVTGDTNTPGSCTHPDCDAARVSFVWKCSMMLGHIGLLPLMAYLYWRHNAFCESYV